ncbi:ABC transporter ATP-binding protein [Promicromonospora sukumoe]|uniref:ABC-type quaternary amine transporter n=1 Tax=Promicromonospora sukumoe TaxID=88382 RepID=A0A7W3J7P8_9MICO|nr:ABC transporter ATP-binding protein [Promicromonospora sukumoe]MBA8807820.1 iron(III) transport system ATP-binding protein [Promicromonospora sukumoe]
MNIPHPRLHQPPALSVHGLRAGYPTDTGRAVVPVLHGIDLTVEAGTVLAVLGPSGCGKTTLLRAVAGLLPAIEGSIEIAGEVMTDGAHSRPPERRRIGLVPQDAALFPHRTVAQNIEFGLRSRRARPLSVAARRERVDAMTALVGLSDLRHRRPHQLSGGQRQRVALARALAPEPALVLLDEPFAALDSALRADLRAEVLEILASVGATALLVTHDQDEALSSTARVVVLRDGVVAQDASPTDLYQRPADPWVARFVGESVVLPGVSNGATAVCALGAVPTSLPAGAVTVVLRPEQIGLEPVAVRTDSTDPIVGPHGTVTGSQYFGHDTLYRVRIAGSAVTVLSRAPGPQVHQVGDQVAIRRVGRAVTFPA